MGPVEAAIISFAYASTVWYMLLYRQANLLRGVEDGWKREKAELLLTIEALEEKVEPVWYIASEGQDLSIQHGTYPPD